MEELLKFVAAGGDVGTLVVVVVYVKHSAMLEQLKGKIDYIERYLLSRVP
ncbi:hypothetical protein [Teredinibacter turnerae]|uniref:Uncharacterized protein n=1 Tax=Teredinibacter turnerae (strain ATCC 39867 / T7901) TaxID=377629 RepID=C5BSP4_TERTT|nr:hypothetical protein [Teredinibacter turnerae]ACR11195.1 hypothetical protein TERTU_1444 [Teredinibacter turnerae T7901]